MSLLLIKTLYKNWLNRLISLLTMLSLYQLDRQITTISSNISKRNRLSIPLEHYITLILYKTQKHLISKTQITLSGRLSTNSYDHIYSHIYCYILSMYSMYVCILCMYSMYVFYVCNNKRRESLSFVESMESNDLLSNRRTIQMPDHVMLYIMESVLGVNSRMLDDLFMRRDYSSDRIYDMTESMFILVGDKLVLRDMLAMGDSVCLRSSHFRRD